MNIPASAPRTGQLSVFGFLILLRLLCATPQAIADVAVLREKGPRSGSVFANPGLTATTPDNLKISMRNADVKIKLRRGEGESLVADCVATFELVDSSAPDSGAKTFLVAFPVTGLRSKMAATSAFKVSVDGVEPPTVLRRAVRISRREATLKDETIRGQLDARLAVAADNRNWGIKMANERFYRDAFAWQQSSVPGATTHVNAAYAVTMKPQSLHYSKAYNEADDDSEVIPFESIQVDKWNDRYYFFDYILISGATWDGTIDREVIEISADPALKLSPYAIECSGRKAIGYRDERKPASDGGGFSESFDSSTGTTIIEIEHEKPGMDVLLCIPFNALGK